MERDREKDLLKTVPRVKSNSQNVEPDLVQENLAKNGKRCPADHSLLKAKLGKRGILVFCSNSVERHFYKLDEI